MIITFKNSVHSLLGFSPPPPPKPADHHSLGLISAVSDDCKSPNVVESSSLNKSLPPKKDPGGFGFIDDIGGGVNGLMSCTESLGFESSDERLVNDVTQTEDERGCGGGRREKPRRRAAAREFPPPLSSLNQHGQPRFYLRPVRTEGRLELTEVEIERPEILRASREDGRLRLHLIKYDDDHHALAEEEEEEETAKQEDGKIVIRRSIEVVNDNRRREHRHGLEETAAEEEEEGEETADQEDGEIVIMRCSEVVNDNHRREHRHELDEETAAEEEEEVGKMVIRRCVEVVNQHRRREHRRGHHHHHLDVWRQHCVLISR